MRTSQQGIDLVKRFEGFSPVAYLCPAGVWTIGYGHTVGVREGDSIDEDRNSRFDSFKYKGKALSDYVSSEWIE